MCHCHYLSEYPLCFLSGIHTTLATEVRGHRLYRVVTSAPCTAMVHGLPQGVPYIVTQSPRTARRPLRRTAPRTARQGLCLLDVRQRRRQRDVQRGQTQQQPAVLVRQREGTTGQRWFRYRRRNHTQQQRRVLPTECTQQDRRQVSSPAPVARFRAPPTQGPLWKPLPAPSPRTHRQSTLASAARQTPAQ